MSTKHYNSISSPYPDHADSIRRLESSLLAAPGTRSDVEHSFGQETDLFPDTPGIEGTQHFRLHIQRAHLLFLSLHDKRFD